MYVHTTTTSILRKSSAGSNAVVISAHSRTLDIEIIKAKTNAIEIVSHKVLSVVLA